MSQTAIKNSFIARAKTLAHVMTRSKNVQVTVSGNSAYNTPGLINIPCGDFTDKEWLKMVVGWIDHELGHEQHTDDPTYQRFAKTGKLEAHILNVIEDVWMEREVGNNFPGARKNLNELVEIAVKRELFTNPVNTTHPLTALSAFLLYEGRSKITGQRCLNDYADTAFSEVEKHFGDKFASNLQLIVTDIANVHSTAGATEISKRVIQLLKQEKETQEENKKSEEEKSDETQSNDTQPEESESKDDKTQGSGSDETQSDDSQPEESGSKDDESQGSGSDETQSDDSQSQESDSIDDESEGKGSDDGESKGSEPKIGESNDSESDGDSSEDSGSESFGDTSDLGDKPLHNPSAQQILDAIDKAINKAHEAELRDFHDALADLLGKDAQESTSELDKEIVENLSLSAIKGDSQAFTSGMHMLDHVFAKRLSGGIYQTMHKALFDQVQNLEVNRRVGTRLVNSKLSGIPAGNLSVFSRRTETQDVSVAISVIVDSSSSMNDNGAKPMLDANACAFAFAMGLDKAGVSSEFIYFGRRTQGSHLMYTAKSFSEKPVASRFTVAAAGGTPTGDAMQFAINTLSLRQENKKILIVITDGDANSESRVVFASKLANSLNIRVVPIGIQTSCVAGFEKDQFVTVNDLSELTSALREAVRNKLFS